MSYLEFDNLFTKLNDTIWSFSATFVFTFFIKLKIATLEEQENIAKIVFFSRYLVQNQLFKKFERCIKLDS